MVGLSRELQRKYINSPFINVLDNLFIDGLTNLLLIDDNAYDQIKKILPCETRPTSLESFGEFHMLNMPVSSRRKLYVLKTSKSKPWQSI